MKTTIKNLFLSECNKTWLLNMEIVNNEVEKLKKIIDSEKPKVIDISIKTEKRSLDSNSYMWTLINKIAIKNSSTEKEIYKIMLRDYGAKEYAVAKIEIRKELMKAYKFVEIVKDVKVDGKAGKLFRLIRGTSTYDTKEMSIMINGIVEEAKALGIQTVSQKEIDEMIERYGK